MRIHYFTHGHVMFPKYERERESITAESGMNSRISAFALESGGMERKGNALIRSITPAENPISSRSFECIVYSFGSSVFCDRIGAHEISIS